jgi:hypothetical protein
VTLLRWILAAAGLSMGVASAWANWSVVLGRYDQPDGQRPSIAFFAGALCAALGLKAVPLQGPKVTLACWAIWLALALVDPGTLGSFTILPLWALVSSLVGTKKEKP